MLITIVISLGVCHRGERDCMNIDFCALLISFVALIITVIDRKFNFVSTESEYRKEILLWYNRCIENLKFLEIVESLKKNELLAELSALIEEGRFFFPNIDIGDGFGKEKLPAYQGYRCHVLDYLVEYYDLMQSEQSSSQRLMELQRRFTSSVFSLLQPKKYIKKMQKTAKKSFADKKSIEDVVGFTLNSRYNRYGDIDASNILFNEDDLKNINPNFYVADNVSERMNQMRIHLINVRKNWNELEYRKNYIKKLCSVIDLREQDVLDKTWCDVDKNITCKDFSFIKTYTSQDGYEKIFSLMNTVFRCENINEEQYDMATFLLEYINIEPFNYIHLKNNEANNFEDVVYRGCYFTEDIVESFKALLQLPVEKRGIGIPLSLMSSSKNINVAFEFLENQQFSDEDIKKQIPVLFKIHVSNLDRDFLDFYHSFYPDSVVSSICAVPIENLSVFKDEEEVLLRGAFFHVINFYELERKVKNIPIKVVEVVMVNSNRDHLTGSSFENTNARKLFNNLVGIQKFRKAREVLENEDERSLYFSAEKKLWQQLLLTEEECKQEKNKNTILGGK